MIELSKLKTAYERAAKQNEKFRVFLKNNAVDYELDAHFRRLHNELFAEYDCCTCSNCCKLYDILVDKYDIKRIAEYLRLSENEFIEQYLDVYEGGYKMKSKPCSFLDAYGKCRIQEIKPAVCQDFPYTDKPYRLYNINGILSFAEDCPIAFEILERLKMIYNYKS